MNLRAIRPTRSQALVGVVTVVVGCLAVVAAALSAWPVALAMVVVLLLAVVAVLLYSSRQLGARINHQATVVNRSLRQLSLGGDSDVTSGVGDSRLGALDHWARTLLGSTAAQERFLQRAKRTRSLSARDLLAHSATRGQYRYEDFAAVMESWRNQRAFRISREEAKRLRLTSALTLARLLYSQRTSDRDLVNALTLYDVVVRATSLGRLNDVDRSHYADLCVDQGRFDRAREILSVREADTASRAGAHAFFEANAANPYLGSPDTDEAAWLTQVNATLAAGGFEPLTLEAGDADPFYRLRCETAAPVTEGPLVSVLMPIYEPDAATDKAIESILNQSWRNVELIMVDDGSPRVDADGRPTGVVEQLRGWAERDERITLILNEHNHGAYWVRNQAYDEARGEFVTVADKDDWHHPQQIEWQVRDLAANRSRVANMVNWVRVNPLLRFLVRWGPDRVVHPSFASMMFRRAEVKERLGYWDTVRKGADNEFRFRLQQAYGFRLNPTEPTPLIFSLMGESNLTSTDLGLGYEHEDRGAYWHAYRAWHAELATSGQTYLERHPERRPFPVPGGFLPERIRGSHFDVVYVVELDSTDARNRRVRDEITAAVGSGFKVGLIPAENFHTTGRAHLDLDAGVDAMIRSGQVTRLATATQATTDLLILRPPSLFQICRDAAAGLVPERVVVVADEPPFARRPTRHNYEVHTVSRHVQTVFGVDPLWIASSDPIRQRLQRLLLRDQLGPELWVGPSSPSSARPATTTEAPRLVVGGYREANTERWMEQLVGADDSGAGGPVLVSGGLWQPTDLDEGGENLAELDAWVCLSDEVDRESEQLTTQAMAQGALLVLSPGYRPVFGDAAVYATAEEARGVLVAAAAQTAQQESAVAGGEDDQPEGERDGVVSETGYVEQLRGAGLQADPAPTALWKE